MRFPLAGLFGREEIVGIDLGDRYVSAAQLGPAAAGGALEVRSAGWVECAPDASEKEQVAAIRRLWHRYGLRSRTVCSCLRSPSLLMRHFELGPLSDHELRPALRLEAEEAMQAQGKDIVVDWWLSPAAGAAPGAGTAKRSGLLVAVPRQEVDRHVRLLHRAGLYPVAVDVGCLAVCNLFLTLRAWRHEDEAVCLVCLLNHSADIAILYRGECIHPRTVLCTSADWEHAVGFLAENIQDALRYYRMKGNAHGVERILLTGSLASGNGLAGTLAETLEFSVERWNPLLTLLGGMARWPMTNEQEAAAASGTLLATCLGLALRSL
ncbi:MAG: pilus assembly protein PilM [Lentisphaeria bacterium]